MAKSAKKTTKPTSWRISDVSNEARAIARATSRANKQTIGQWLSEIILSATESLSAVDSGKTGSETAQKLALDMGAIEERLIRSLDRSQDKSSSEIGGLQDTLSRLDERLRDIEKRRNSG